MWLETSKTDAQGNVTTYSYYPNGNLESIQYSADTDTFDYGGDGGGGGDEEGSAGEEVPSVTDSASGDTYSFAYGDDGQLDTITDTASSLIWDYSYNTDNLLSLVTTPSGGSSEFTYAADGRLVGETESIGGSTVHRSIVSEESLLLDVPSGEGSSSENPIQLIPSSQVQASVTDSSGQTTTYTTDSFGAQRRFPDQRPGPDHDLPSCDAVGNVTQETAPGANGQSLVTSYTYDANQSLTQEVDPDGSVQTWQFNPTWNVVTSHTDQLGNVTNYTIDLNTGLTTSTTTAAGTPQAATTYDIYSNSANGARHGAQSSYLGANGRNSYLANSV